MSIDKSTLYVSDLDGTLLRPTQDLSPYTIKIVNGLIEDGMNFSYATARSYVTASKVTLGLSAKLPAIVYNGAFIIEQSTQKMMLSNFFNQVETNEIRDILEENNVGPLVYSFINDKERFSYHRETLTSGLANFVLSRMGDIRENPIADLKALYGGKIFYFLCVDSEEKLSLVNDCLKHKYNCIYQRDIYSGDQWLEILPLNASKANAILQLKEYLGCKKIISFGDGKNDISMFKLSDECYAVENAVDELKEIATGIISSNASDAVARWLSQAACS